MQARFEQKGKKNNKGKSFLNFFKSREKMNSFKNLKDFPAETSDEKFDGNVPGTPNSAIEIKDSGLEAEKLDLSPSKKSSEALNSIDIDSLISVEKDPVLWRATLVYEVIGEQNAESFKIRSNYPWHTVQSLLTLENTRLQMELYQVKGQQIVLLRQIFKILDFGYHNYLDETEDKFEQAKHLPKYLRSCIETVMSDSFFDSASFIGSLSHDDQIKRYLETSKFVDEQQEFRLRAVIQLQPLRFHQAVEFNDLSLSEVLPYLCPHQDLPEYDTLLAKLEERTMKSGFLVKRIKEHITKLRLAIEAGEIPVGYTSLRSLLPNNEAFRTILMRVLSAELHQGYSLDKFPKCTTEEPDLFIPKNSTLEATLTDKIGDFSRIYKKLHEKNTSSRLFESAAKSLARELKSELLRERGYQLESESSRLGI